jgi:hypothetical protein
MQIASLKRERTVRQHTPQLKGLARSDRRRHRVNRTNESLMGFDAWVPNEGFSLPSALPVPKLTLTTVV